MCALLITLFAATGADVGRAALPTAPDDLGQFPRVEGANLEGRRFILPADFEGAFDVVVVAFQREQQRDVDGWMPFLKGLAAERSDLRVYELPTLERRYRPMRQIIDGGMRRGIPDAAVRAATVTLYVDKSAFRRALRLGDEDRVYVLLVDRAGRVHWRADGPFDATVADGLRRHLAGTTPVPIARPLRRRDAEEGGAIAPRNPARHVQVAPRVPAHAAGRPYPVELSAWTERERGGWKGPDDQPTAARDERPQLLSVDVAGDRQDGDRAARSP